MHQGMGLEAYNALPLRRAVHAVFECCCCVTLATDLAKGRPYPDHASLFAKADELLFSLGEASMDTILQAYPCVGSRPHSEKSRGEQCAVWDADATVMAQLDEAARRYCERFGFGFVMYVGDSCARDALAAMDLRLHNDHETERKVVRNELSRINRARLERMLGPEGGYDNWCPD